MNLIKLSATLFFIFLILIPPAFAQQGGIANQLAPSWEVDTWLNLPAGKKILDVSDFKGKVIYLMAFQQW